MILQPILSRLLRSKPMITKSIGKYGEEEGNFKGPRGIAIDPSSQNIYIADSINSRIQIFSKDLTYQFSFPKASDKVRLHLPWGICIQDSLVFITASSIDYFERRAQHGIYVYTLEGNLITGSNRQTVKEKDMKLCVPQGIAVDSENNLFIADYNNSRVIAYTATLPVYNVIVTSEKKPKDVAFYRDRLYILFNNGHVVRMGLDLKTEMVIDYKENACKAEFFSLCNDIIYISDQKRNQIVEYSVKDGEMLRTIGDSKMFTHIKGLACDRDSNVVVSVCEREDSRLKLIAL